MSHRKYSLFDTKRHEAMTSNLTPNRPLKLVFLISGNGSNLQAIIDNINQGKLNAIISTVISDKEDSYGLTRATKASIPTELCLRQHFPSKQEHEQALATLVSKYQPDLVVLAGFMKKLSAEFIYRFPSKILNIHPSLLPKFKGLNTHQRAIDAKESEHGATVHVVTPDLDSGPIIIQSAVSITAEDTAETLGNKVLETEHIIYSQVIQYLAETPQALKSLATLSMQKPKRSK